MAEGYVNSNIIAFIIDNEVVQVISTDDRIAAIWLSNPTIVNITGENGVGIASIGDIYDPATKTFSSPNNDVYDPVTQTISFSEPIE